MRQRRGGEVFWWKRANDQYNKSLSHTNTACMLQGKGALGSFGGALRQTCLIHECESGNSAVAPHEPTPHTGRIAAVQRGVPARLDPGPLLLELPTTSAAWVRILAGGRALFGAGAQTPSARVGCGCVAREAEQATSNSWAAAASCNVPVGSTSSFLRTVCGPSTAKEWEGC